MLQVMPFIRIAAGDVVSKAILVGINLYLIRFLAIDQYSHFTLLLNAMFLGYQLACGPLERLFIAEHKKYRKNLQSLQWTLCGFSSFCCVLWLWREADLTDLFLIVLGIYLLADYQVFRIRLQQRLFFTAFSVAEILKNGMWVMLLVLLFSASLLPPSVAALVALLLGTSIALYILKFVVESGLPVIENGESSCKMASVLWNSKNVIIYSLIGAAIPYLPIVMASSFGDNKSVATYGAAMRYQAILGMAVFTFNTVLLPQMAALSEEKKERDRLIHRLRKLAPLLFILYTSAVFLIWWAVPYIDQGKYAHLRKVFLILSITPALSLISTPYVNKLLLEGRTQALLVCMTAGLGANLFVFYFFNEKLMAFSPAWASVSAYVTVTFMIISLAKLGKHKLITER